MSSGGQNELANIMLEVFSSSCLTFLRTFWKSVAITVRPVEIL